MIRTALSFHFLIRAAIAVTALASTAAMAADLTIIVENVNNAGGTIRAGLFNKAENFPNEPVSGQTIEARPGIVSFVFKGLEPGSYAISTFHDINGNQELDTNFVGMPIEPYGFSRGARGKIGPPSFHDASVAVDGRDQSITIQLK